MLHPPPKRLPSPRQIRLDAGLHIHRLMSAPLPRPPATQPIRYVLRDGLVRGLIVGLISAGVVAALLAGGLFSSLRASLNDTYFLPRPATDRLAIIALDDASRAAYGRSVTAWPRDLYADAVTNLAAAGARVIGFDILFAEEDATGDSVLVAALEAARQSTTRTRILMPAVGITALPDDTQRDTLDQYLLNYTDVLRPQEIFRDAADYVGFVNVLPDSDNVIRQQLSRVHHARGLMDDVELGYAVAAYLAYLRVPASAASQVITVQDDLLNIGPSAVLPIDGNGIWRQNFFRAPDADAATPFPVIPFTAAVEGTFDPALIADRIVLIGMVNSTGAGDRYPVPFARDGRLVSGVEIHAHAIETLLQNLPVQTQSPPAALLTLVGVALVCSLGYAGLRWYGILMATALALIGWLVIGSLVFESQRVIIDLLFGIVAIVLPATIHLVLIGREEGRLRRRSELSLSVVEAIIEGSPGPIMVLDDALTVRRANTSFRQHIAPASAGEPFTTVLGRLRLDDAVCDEWLAGLRGEVPFTFDIQLAEKTFSVNGAAVTTPDGQRDRVLLISDVSTLADLNRLRTQMIRMASHDLKNPLNNVLGFTNLLQENADDDRLPPTVRQFLGYIESSANDMRRIIEGVLGLEKARSGRLNKQRLTLASVLADVMLRCQPQADEKKQRLIAHIDDDLPPVLGDSFQVTQAFFNLVENGIKYTPEAGSVTVRLFQQESVIVLEVADTGYGIPADAQSGIFKEFFRAVSGATSNIKGTGLGLSLVKTIIDLHGGRIRFVSTEGVGTTFTVELPIHDENIPVQQEAVYAG